MDSVRGEDKEVFEALLREVSEPLVTLPSVGNCRAFVRAIRESETDRTVRVLLDTGIADELSWRTQSLAADLRLDGVLSLRVGSVSDVVLIGESTVGMVDQSGTESVGLVGYESLRDYYDRRWERGASVDLDACPRSELIEAATETIGEPAGEVLRSESGRDPARSSTTGDVDPVKLLVWGGAVAGAGVTDVREVVLERGLCARRTLERRIDALCEEGLVETPRRREGTPGRPERVLSLAVDVDDPTHPPDGIRAALI